MTTFSYSSGDPANLTGGATANMADISGPFTDLRTFINGSIDTTNLATSAKPVTLQAPYRVIHEVQFRYPALAPQTAPNWPSALEDSAGRQAFANGGQGLSKVAPITFAFDPADYAITSLTTRLRLQMITQVNGTAPAANFTGGMYPVTAIGGTAGSMSATLGTLVSGSSVAKNTPGTNSITSPPDSSGDFAVPVAGIYAIGMTCSATPPANSLTILNLRLTLHHI